MIKNTMIDSNTHMKLGEWWSMAEEPASGPEVTRERLAEQVEAGLEILETKVVVVDTENNFLILIDS